MNQGLSLAPYIMKNMPSLAKTLSGVGARYANVAGWRKQGLKYDDLRTWIHYSLGYSNSKFRTVVEETPTVQKVRHTNIWI